MEGIKESGVSYDSDHSVAENNLESGNVDKVEKAWEATIMRLHFHWRHFLLPRPTCMIQVVSEYTNVNVFVFVLLCI